MGKGEEDTSRWEFSKEAIEHQLVAKGRENFVGKDKPPMRESGLEE